MELPSFLESGDIARLFPVISETGKEQRATSILLSVLSAVPTYADALFSQIGQSISKRTSVDTYTEVVFRKEGVSQSKDRPDGLVQIKTGKRQWNALVEAKIGKQGLDQDQIEKYLRIARDNSIDAVVTISNEFAALPTHHPIQVQRNLTRRVSLYHFSWSSVLTEAILLHDSSAVTDREQAFMLRELVRFLSHKSAGVEGFSSMPSEWSGAIDQLQAGGAVQPRGLGSKIVGAWYQEIRDVSLQMSRIIGCNISLKLPRKHKNNPEARFRDDLERLCAKGYLETNLSIPDAASDLKIVADLRSRSLRISMKVDAPRDRQSTKARVNWLLRQMKDVDHGHVSVSLDWASKSPDTVVALQDLKANPDLVKEMKVGAEVKAFEIVLRNESARRFSGRQTFVQELERLAPLFYELIGQNLQTWNPSPPKPKHSVKTEKNSEEHQGEIEDSKPVKSASHQSSTLESEQRNSGNQHDDLLEVPDFLNRLKTNISAS